MILCMRLSFRLRLFFVFRVVCVFVLGGNGSFEGYVGIDRAFARGLDDGGFVLFGVGFLIFFFGNVIRYLNTRRL